MCSCSARATSHFRLSVASAEKAPAVSGITSTKGQESQTRMKSPPFAAKAVIQPSNSARASADGFCSRSKQMLQPTGIQVEPSGLAK